MEFSEKTIKISIDEEKCEGCATHACVEACKTYARGILILRDVFANTQLAEILQVRQALEEQDAFDDDVGVLHLVDRLAVLVVAQLVEAPVLQHPRMQEILVDRR